mgnify:FL=1
MDNNEKKFVGWGKQNGDYYININLTKSKIMNHFFEYKGEEYIRLTVGKKKEADQFGKTHWVAVNNYKSEQQKEGKKPVSAGDHLPF